MKKLLNSWKSPKFGKRHKPTDSQSWKNLKEKIISKKHTSRHIIVKLLKTKEEKLFEVARKKWTLAIIENNLNKIIFLIRNHGGKK